MGLGRAGFFVEWRLILVTLLVAEWRMTGDAMRCDLA